MSRKQVPHEFDGAANGGLRFGQSRTKLALHFLVQVERAVQVPRQKLVSGVVRCPNELLKELEGQGNLLLAGMLHDDLSEDEVSEVFARPCVQYFHINSIADHACDIVELDVAAGAGIVQPSVAVLLDDDLGTGIVAGGFLRPGFALHTAPQRDTAGARSQAAASIRQGRRLAMTGSFRARL